MPRHRIVRILDSLSRWPIESPTARDERARSVAPQGVELEKGNHYHDQEFEEKPERPPHHAAQQHERFVFRAIGPIARTLERGACGTKHSAVRANPRGA
jgi:hypothetical protein